MNRRTLLKALAALPFLGLKTAAPAAETREVTVKYDPVLMRKIERDFDKRVGYLPHIYGIHGDTGESP